MEKLVVFVVERMIINKLIQDDDREIYVYSMQILLEKIIGFSAIYVLAIEWNLFIESILFVLFFSFLRKHTSGFHLSRFCTCFFSSVGIFVIFVEWIYPFFFKHMKWSYIVLVMALLVILCIGAVNNPYIDWTSYEYQENKKIARGIVVLEVMVIVIFDILGMDSSYLVFMDFGVALSAMLLLIEKIRREVLSHEKNESNSTEAYRANCKSDGGERKTGMAADMSNIVTSAKKS